MEGPIRCWEGFEARTTWEYDTYTIKLVISLVLIEHVIKSSVHPAVIVARPGNFTHDTVARHENDTDFFVYGF